MPGFLTHLIFSPTFTDADAEDGASATADIDNLGRIWLCWLPRNAGATHDEVNAATLWSAASAKNKLYMVECIVQVVLLDDKKTPANKIVMKK